MFNSRSKPPTSAPSQPSEQPKDALSALMDGDTPDAKSLRFPNERTDSWRGAGSSSKGKEQEFDDLYNYQSNTGQNRPHKQAYDNVKSGAANTGTYIKQKSSAGASYVKEKDWSKEKEFAGKAGTATKNGAMAVGSGVAKGAGWLWSSTKNGFNNLTDPSRK